MSKLAIFGGSPVRQNLFPAYNTMGEEEVEAVSKVIRGGVLSKYLGCWDPDFFGGPVVQEFEKKWAEKNQSKFAVSVNSNTSGLITALGAVGVKPGDEVITSPYTMSASASSCLFWGGIPIFADIDPKTFNITADTIRSQITSKTKAIVVVHIFGYPADMDEIMAMANEKNIFVIEDCAQSPFTTYKDKFVGNFGHIGVFSLNYHKHIHTGEGGVITTNDDELATRCQLIRNHAEAVVDDMGVTDLTNMWGFNFRMPEMEAAIGLEQIKKIDLLTEQRFQNVNYLINALKNLEYLDFCHYDIKQGEHAYYAQPIKYNSEKNNGLHRNKYLKALSAEIPSSHLRDGEGDGLIGGGYVKPIYLQSIYQKIAFNVFGRTDLAYPKGLCPATEEMHFNQLITTELMRPSMTKSDLDQVIEAFNKVDEHMSEIIARQDEL
jgi:perosamine synthetase